MDYLNIDDELVFDDNVTGFSFRDYEAYAGARFENNDEIRIEVKNQDAYTVPSESYLYVEGLLTLANAENDPPVRTNLINNCLAHMISEIKYYVNDVEVDQTRSPGYASTLKGLLSFSKSKIASLTYAGWSNAATAQVLHATGAFNVMVPLSSLLGFFEDYNKLMINCKQELVLVRAGNHHNAIISTANEQQAVERTRLQITKLKWKMPHVEVNDEQKLRLLNRLQVDKPIVMGYRSWFFAEKPLPVTTNRDEWQLQSMTSLERPRFIIITFQTNRKNVPTADCNIYDHCNVRNVRALINGKKYPYVDFNVDQASNKYAYLHSAYSAFQKSYYNYQSSDPVWDYTTFTNNGPVFVIDCSKQDERIKSGSVDVRMEIEASENFPAGSIALCLLLHDKVVEYSPLTNIVRRHV
jgi:hypothetical protein